MKGKVDGRDLLLANAVSFDAFCALHIVGGRAGCRSGEESC